MKLNLLQPNWLEVCQAIAKSSERTDYTPISVDDSPIWIGIKKADSDTTTLSICAILKPYEVLEVAIALVEAYLESVDKAEVLGTETPSKEYLEYLLWNTPTIVRYESPKYAANTLLGELRGKWKNKKMCLGNKVFEGANRQFLVTSLHPTHSMIWAGITDAIADATAKRDCFYSDNLSNYIADFCEYTVPF